MFGLNLATGLPRFPIIGGPAGAPAPPGFPVNAVHFDGTNDYLTRGAPLTGAVDGEDILESLWFRADDVGMDGVFSIMSRATGGQIQLTRDNNDKIAVLLQSSAIVLFNTVGDATFNSTTNTGWHHLLVAAQLDVTPVVQLYMDDAPFAHTPLTSPINGNIDFTVADWGIGGTEVGGNKMLGDLAEVYMAMEYLDISVEANRRKFIDAAGKPVDLGADGSTPTGTQPIMFFSGDTVGWHTNLGSGLGFTENGAITDAATSPSD